MRALLSCLTLASVVVLTGCPPSEPPSGPDHDASELPGAYRAWGHGTVEIGDARVDGRIELGYLVRPDDSVVLTRMQAWVDDVDLVVPFLWWELSREPLRCTSFVAVRNAAGTLAGQTVVIPAGRVRLDGTTFAKRLSVERCSGEQRALQIDPDAPVEWTHDPDDDRFELGATFSGEHEGNGFTVAVELEGAFHNRPPRVALAHGAPGQAESELTAGCPAPKSIANRPRGLELQLVSRSEDPDGHGIRGSSVKLSRADLWRENWTRPEGFIGEGRRLGSVLFEAGRDHELTLTVTDHSGARARKSCRFHVAEGS